MHADDDVAARSHVEAIRMIEAVTRDVQVPIPATQFQAFETKEAVICACDQRSDLGGSLFDLAAMGRENDDARAGTLDLSDAKIPSLRLVLRKFPERCVLAHAIPVLNAHGIHRTIREHRGCEEPGDPEIVGARREWEIVESGSALLQVHHLLSHPLPEIRRGRYAL